MNKGELISRIASQTKLSKAQTGNSVDAFINAIVATLKKGGKVTLVGFGTFSISRRSSRKGRNPQTGKLMTIPSRKVVKFKAGKDFAAKVR